MQKILIIGSGDVARRILPHLAGRYRVFALLRNAARAKDWRADGVQPLIADLDERCSLDRIAGLADVVLHLAPPPNQGLVDLRTKHLLAALGKGKSLPRRLIYVSTTGVYGDCGGALIDETRRLNAESPRAARRIDAEQTLRAWGDAMESRSAFCVPPVFMRPTVCRSSAWKKACRRCWPPMMYSPITFMPKISLPPALRRFATGRRIVPTTRSMIPI